MKKLIYIIVVFLFFACQATQVEEYSKDFTQKNHLVYFKGNLYTGILIAHDDYDQKVYEQVYKNGKLDGASKRWHQNGLLAEVRNYHHGNKTKEHKGWWSNGQQKFEFRFDEKGLLTGVLKEWYANGQLFKDFNYLKGQEAGSQKMWTKEGDYKANYVIKNGEKFGLIGSKKCDAVD